MELSFLLALHDWQSCAWKDEGKKKHAAGHEVGSTQTPSGGERVEFMVCPTGAADRVVYWMLCACKVENGYSFTVKYQISEIC